jgi:heme/copper-type cytochrome/quinol oxidase subunit 2
MRAVIVPLTLIVLAFLAFCIWQLRSAAEKKRREEHEREKEREKWADDMLRGDQ